MNRILLTLIIAAACVSCSVMCKRSSGLKNTCWSYEYQEFLADVGNITITTTLEFTSATEYELTTTFDTPPHPTMYMSTDGSVDTIPGSTSSYTSKGTYGAKKDEVILTDKDGATHTLRREAGMLLSDPDGLSYRALALSRVEKK